MGGDEICNNKYIVNVFGTSLNLVKYYHAQCVFFIINYRSSSWLRTGWLKIEDWKMKEDGSADG